MFSNSFPNVKSPDELLFEAEMESAMMDKEVNIDELSCGGFVSDGESEGDDDIMHAVCDELGMLDKCTEGKKICRPSVGEKTKYGVIKDVDIEITNGNKINQKLEIRKMKKEISQMKKNDKEAIGALFRSVKEMRKASALNYIALTRMRDLMMKYPPLDFLYKVVKPMGEIMPQDPINTQDPLLRANHLEGSSTHDKIPTKQIEKMKCIPKRYYKKGVLHYYCNYPDCKFTRRSWGAVDTHIMITHLKSKYVCTDCKKEMGSSDGYRRHMQKFHGKFLEKKE